MGQAQRSWDKKTCPAKLLYMVERFGLYHVKTLCYTETDQVLAWLGASENERPLFKTREMASAVREFCVNKNLTDVQITDTLHEPCCDLRGKRRFIVYVAHRHEVGRLVSYDAVVLFLVIQRDRASSHQWWQHDEDVRDSVDALKKHIIHLPTFYSCKKYDVEPKRQETRPVIRGFLPSSYDTTSTTRTPAVTVDGFGRKYKPVECTVDPSPWSIYRGVGEAVNAERRGTDVEELIAGTGAGESRVLGQGGFGVTVALDEGLVAKTNCFPEMIDWSVPCIRSDFLRYAHVAAQAEELMIGVSMKHPNILRTFAGFWCEAPTCQFGGRVVLVMERALTSLRGFVLAAKSSCSLPVVELDTLRGLAYMRRRGMQHRDFTYKNVLVCHQPGRRPVPFAFKISDFGTSVNFCTPDQHRGNRTNMPPEALWCLISTVDGDVFSWYCVMWELYTGEPLIRYRAAAGGSQTYCRKTYARNLSELVGVYEPQDGVGLDNSYMLAMDARGLLRAYGGRRPSARDIRDKLRSRARKLDPRFVDMAMLCVTLFPQERWSPQQLLDLPRYASLAADVTYAEVPDAAREPFSVVKLGDCKTTDVIIGDDCTPAWLTELAGAPGSAVTSISGETKKYYGVDYIRLTPGLIEPNVWYSDKAERLKRLFEDKFTASREPEKTKSEPVSKNEDRGTARKQLVATEPPGAVRVFGKTAPGEIDVNTVILESQAERDVELFKNNVVLLSQEMTRRRPDLFAGPRDGLLRCSRSYGVFMFQFAQLFDHAKPVNEWTRSDGSPTCSVYAFLAQVFLTLKAALEAEVLPTHMAEWRYVIVGKGGAVMFDVSTYLGHNYSRPRHTLFGGSCDKLVDLCTGLVCQYIPDSTLCRWLRTLSCSTAALNWVIDESINWLNEACPGVSRSAPCTPTPADSVVTFKDYLSWSPHWLADDTLGCGKSGARTLVYGNPSPVSGDQTSASATDVNAVTKSLIARLKTRTFGPIRVNVTGLDCTRGALRIAVRTSALANVLSVNELGGSETLQQLSFAHDTVSVDHSRWTSILMIKKGTRHNPVEMVTTDYFTVIILFVLIDDKHRKSYESLDRLFSTLTVFGSYD